MDLYIFSENKSISKWLEDERCAQDIDYDIIQKRIKLWGEVEKVITTPRTKHLNTRSLERKKQKDIREVTRLINFQRASDIRADHSKGISIKDLCHNYGKTRTYVSKIINNKLWYNPHRK